MSGVQQPAATAAAIETPSVDHDHDHENPIDVSDVTDDERAEMLETFLKAYADEFGDLPRLMPLEEDGKGPVAGPCYSAGREHLVEAITAVERIREEGARGFAIYAGRWDCNTSDLVMVDVDDRETFPYDRFPQTLTVLSGSGRGEHFTFRNGGDVENAKGKGEVDGEIRSENWYCITPGSVHPSGGVYHVLEDYDVATLEADQIPEDLRPGSRTEADVDFDDLDLPDPDEDDAEFRNQHGVSLATLREHDGKLDRLLKDLEPGYPLDERDNSASGYDLATAGKLWFWGFSRAQIATLMRKYRGRSKVTDRDGYLSTTINKVTGPDEDRWEPTPRCPECGWALGEHTKVNENPPVWFCDADSCRREWEADDVFHLLRDDGEDGGGA